VIKVQDIVYCVFGSQDPGRMVRFLTDFGMVENDRTSDRIFMRGAGSYPYINVIERGDPGFVALGMLVGSEGELKEATELPGASGVETIDGPGGGRRVRLRGPDGYRIDLVHGMEPAPQLPVRAPLAINYGWQKQRIVDLQRPAFEPARIVRLGHCVLKFSDGDAAAAWLGDTLGMLRTDRLHAPDNAAATLGTFMRCDRGGNPADHHTIFALQGMPGDVGLHHTAYEVQDPDAVHIGNRWLHTKEYLSEWGVGRHLLGSQVFDYWRSPDGNIFEHYADGDLLTSDVEPGDYPATQENLAQWGPELPPTFFQSVRVAG
jgi:catechol 2,3-dioxygenase-like lactoylglutathione lyase family enzyme